MGKLKLKSINDIRRKLGMGDIRYNNPKEAPKTSTELVDDTIMKTEIYRQARVAILQRITRNYNARAIILNIQAKQVAYGLDKYPEPLNPNTWSISETVAHIMDESIDKLHYLVMLRIKLEQELVANWANDNRSITKSLEAINDMIDSNIGEMNYLVTMDIEGPTLKQAARDSMDAMVYGLKYMQAGADFDGDTALVEYTKADVEATLKFHEEMVKGDED